MEEQEKNESKKVLGITLIERICKNKRFYVVKHNGLERYHVTEEQAKEDFNTIVEANGAKENEKVLMSA